MKKFINKLQYIKLYEILGCFIFIILLPISLIYKFFLKLSKRKIWLVSETSDTARDNGYHFYKYLKEQHKEIESYYVIDKKVSDFKKVENFGNIIQFRSFKHWLYYMVADKIISSAKNASPDHPLFSLLHIKFNLFNNFVFLQHGIILNDFPMFYYKNTKFKLFICGAKDEYDYISKGYGYPKERVVYTGLARFDNLIDNNVNKKQILIIPTWRRWLGREKNFLGQEENFLNTLYYRSWTNILNNKKLIEYIEKNNIIVKFYPHAGMNRFIESFKSTSKNIIVLDNSKEDIQKLLKESALMVTDYSSICNDFAFMKKPIIFYQFDREEFFTKHTNPGYFDFKNDGFGDVIENLNDVTDKIIYYIENDYKVEDKYLDKMESFFKLHDNKNCERIFNEICKIK